MGDMQTTVLDAPGAQPDRHATRARLRGLLARHPGLTPAQAARALGIDRTTAHYHLRRLAREGAAVTDGRPARPRWFAPGALRRDRRPAFLAERDANGLLDALRASPGATQSDLARRLGVPRATLAWRLARLRDAGLVRATREGRKVLLHAEAPGGRGRPEESL